MKEDVQNIINMIDSAKEEMITIQTTLAEKNLPQDKEVGKKIYELTQLLNQALKIMKEII